MKHSIKNEILARFKEIQLPDIMGSLEKKYIKGFFFQRHWLVFIKRPDKDYVFIIPPKDLSVN